MTTSVNIPPIQDYPVFVSPRSETYSDNVTLPQLYEWHAKHNPDYPLFLIYDGSTVRSLTHTHAIKGVRRAAQIVSGIAGTVERQIIGIFGSSETITYAFTILGILRAGHIAFPISPRNSAAAVAHLLRTTGCKHVIVSQDAYTQSVTGEAMSTVEQVTLHPTFVLSDLLSATNDAIDTPAVKFNRDDPAVILHSSGTTNHPKPIYWTHKGLIRWSTGVWYGEANLTGAIVGIHAIPMFHAFGTAALLIAASTGWILSVFPPASPPAAPTPDSVFDGAYKTNSDYMMTVPLFIEKWARDPEKVKYMVKMKGLVFGGAPLNKEVGDALASAGVALLTAYGCTELGTISTSLPVDPGMDWEYFRITPWLSHVLVDGGDGYSEVVAIATANHPLAVINTKVNGVDGYAAGDLLEPHPTKPGLWKVFGRRDDQIIHSNGEKTNPIPLEQIINEDPHIHSCLIFGQGRFQNGLLIRPAPEFDCDPLDEKSLESFRNAVWNAIERANEYAPQHSRIFKEMILLSSPTKPFTYNSKGYPRRLAIIQEYKEEIDRLYATIEQSSQNDVAPPTRWDLDNVVDLVRRVVHGVLHQSPNDDTDIFQSGCDSLQATWIRNTILRIVREHSAASAKRLPMNFVFQYPSVHALSDAVLRSLSDTSYMTSGVSSTDDMLQLAERYSSDLPSRPSQLRSQNSRRHVVLITGTTGGFGCDILEHLLRSSKVTKVYALNRLSSNAVERQRARFRERGHDETLLDQDKFKMVEADLESELLGVDVGLLDEICNSVTHIIHNAWQVNFNLSLPSFEGDLRRLRKLIELALRSPYEAPPKVMFVSSIGVVGQYQSSANVPESFVEPTAAVSSGYSQSKWVAEKILQLVSQRVDVQTISLRLGQVCGDRLGHWNESEWFPSLVKSAFFTHSLPDMKNEPSFIPSYPAAGALVEMLETTSPVVHLVHPHPVKWHTLMNPIAEELKVPLVSYDEWLMSLEKCAVEGTPGEVDAMRSNPALRLLDFFRVQGSARTPGPTETLSLSTENAEKASETLRSLPVLGAEDSQRWMKAWRASGFL
ncbi:acetyl-CoA synthetase-like protein [Daedaleopsis nitida]|nr:acetyl-CoA synthetase-like protein [Daedaleopsis nitida]